ncbi:argininosuccinate synthase [Egicoccus halophilus]|uniref:Argininosuccinate synthase n=1 Tax=Egicoccus halophilus TaxID=1670830 RepID=A0A8J3EUM8_9ACTN|nr:argininosuccinate synthase [Egicoccus halophilus]GGI07508.1 argininosuccinate synthase [Egicoccus halophilus]
MSKPRIVLAYSGGLDTSVAIQWMREHKDVEVVACAVDVGQGVDDLDEIRQRGLDCGAVESVVVDARDEFATEFIQPALKANAMYMGKYPLVSALSRPLIVKHLVRVARETGAAGVAHGCTGKGNDQVRFEVGTMCLAPDLDTIAPIREWGLTRDAAIDWANERGIPIPVKSKSSPYSIDENAWGRTAECGILEDPWAAPPEDVFERTVSVKDAPDAPEELVVAFEHGVPVTLDGERLPLAELVAQLDARAGAHGVGRIDMIEDRLVGIKSREIYECPGAIALLTAHRDLEDLCLEQELAEHKRSEEGRYAQLIYNGLWWGPLKKALDAFMDEANRYVNGEVRLELFKGHATVVGRRSADSGLYQYEMATYDAEDQFDQSLAEGFVKLWGLPLKTWAARATQQGDRL